MITIREKILLRMKELQVRQTTLCEKIGMRQQNLSAYLRGARTIPFNMLEKTCMVLGLTLGSVDKVYNPQNSNASCSEKKSVEK